MGLKRKPKRDYTPVTEPIGFNGTYEFGGVNSHGLLDDRLDALFADVRADLHAKLDAIAAGEVDLDAPVEGASD